MELMDEHRLSFDVELISCPGCSKDLTTRTTDRGWCRCGWFCWARTRDEIKAAFEFHVQWTADNAAKFAAEAEARKVGRDLATAGTLHQLRWTDSLKQIGFCLGCQWRLDAGLSSSEIEQAFQIHLRAAVDRPTGWLHG